MEINDEVIQELNSLVGTDVSKLKEIHLMYENILKRNQETEEKLGNPSDGIKSMVDECQIVINTSEALIDKYSQLNTELNSLQDKSKDVRDILETKIKDIQEIQKLQSYFRWLSKLDSINADLFEDLNQEKRQAALFDFQQLIETWKLLKTTKCLNLLLYIEKLVLFWQNLLQENLGRELDKHLQLMYWPNVNPGSSESAKIPLPENIAKFEVSFRILLQLELPTEISKKKEKCPEELDNLPLPLQIMFAHFQKRFIYHFIKNRKTSRLDKPEWYFTQILTWIRDNVYFMNKYVQPLLDEANIKKSAKLLLMQGLVHLVCWKLKCDMPTLIFDDVLMTHAVDETLLLEKELQRQGYIQMTPSPIQVITEEQPFTKWLTLELKLAEERMDNVFSSDQAWQCRYSLQENLDELKVPELTESFMTMLVLMTDRYKLLPELEHKLAFLNLQLKLLDDFRLRLQQLRNSEVNEPLESRFPHIINSISYVILVLGEWSNLPFFFQLYYSQKTLSGSQSSDNFTEIEDKETGGVFQSVISLFEHMQQELLKTLQNWILCDVKAKSRPYRKEKWFSIVASEIAELSQGAYPMLKVLKDHLHRAQEMISPSLFENAIYQIAREFSTYIFEEVILQNVFSEGGAAQLNQDLIRNIQPVFATYLKRPEQYFKEVKESCQILSLPKGSALLLKEVLKSPLNEAVDALEEQGIVRLTPAQAVLVLEKRTDMS